MKHGTILCSLLLIIAIASISAEAVELRFEPDDGLFPIGQPGFLSVIVDEALDIRTVELTIEYDEQIVQSLSGNPGQIFLDSNCSLFLDFQNDTPGEWYGTAITLGWNCWATGPGELYRWGFLPLIEGSCPIHVLFVRLFDPDGNIIPDVTLSDTWIFTGDGTAVPEAATPAPYLDLYPNPFNPGVSLSLSGPVGAARLDVVDVRGRLLLELWRGELSSAPRRVAWDGRDAAGRAMPSGVYLFRLALADGSEQVRRGVLIE